MKLNELKQLLDTYNTLPSDNPPVVFEHLGEILPVNAVSNGVHENQCVLIMESNRPDDPAEAAVGVCPVCESYCYQTSNYPAEINTPAYLGAAVCSGCGEFWALEPAIATRGRLRT